METLRFINNSSTNVNYKLQILNGSKKDEIMIFPKPGLQGEPYFFFLSRGIHQIKFGQILFVTSLVNFCLFLENRELIGGHENRTG